MSGIYTAVAVGVAGLAAGAYSANKAASAQQSAAASASNTQLSMFGQTQANEQPYINRGNAASNALGAYYGLPGSTGPSAAQFQSTLSNLPGYQFQLNQGHASN
jgi:hypothetical protein